MLSTMSGVDILVELRRGRSQVGLSGTLSVGDKSRANATKSNICS